LCSAFAAAARLLLTAGPAAVDGYLVTAGPTAANPQQLHAPAGSSSSSSSS